MAAMALIVFGIVQMVFARWEWQTQMYRWPARATVSQMDAVWHTVGRWRVRAAQASRY